MYIYVCVYIYIYIAMMIVRPGYITNIIHHKTHGIWCFYGDPSVILKELEPQKMANCAMSCAKQLGLVAEEVVPFEGENAGIWVLWVD